MGGLGEGFEPRISRMDTDGFSGGRGLGEGVWGGGARVGTWEGWTEGQRG